MCRAGTRHHPAAPRTRANDCYLFVLLLLLSVRLHCFSPRYRAAPNSTLTLENKTCPHLDSAEFQCRFLLAPVLSLLRSPGYTKICYVLPELPLAVPGLESTSSYSVEYKTILPTNHSIPVILLLRYWHSALINSNFETGLSTLPRLSRFSK